jgi:Right handed beta helix region
MIIVRRSGIDSIAGGRLQRHTVRSPGGLTLSAMLPYVPSDWLSLDGGTARLDAVLVLSTGVTLEVSAPITRLVLTGGPAAPAAASIYTGGGRLGLRGVTVTSADAATSTVMPVGPGRPFIVVSRGGRLDAVDATIGDLGTKVERTGNPGLTFNAGSGGSLVRTNLPRNSVGLELDRSDGVRLEDVTVTRSDTDGLLLRGDVGTALVGVRAESNGDNGVVVSGVSSARPVTGIATRDNHAFGVAVVGQTGTRLAGVTTTADKAGGLEISHSTGVTVTGFTAADQPIGVYTHVSSSGISLDAVTVTGGRRGVVVEKTTTDLRLTGSRIDGTDLGVSVGAHRIGLRDVTVTNSGTGVAIQRGAGDITVDDLSITGGKDGLVANPGTTGVVVRNLTAEGVSNSAVRALSPGGQILGGRIDGSSTGIDVQAPTTVTGVAINRADTGIRARTPDQVRAYQVDIAAISVGIDVAAGTPFLLTNSRVHALESIRGLPVYSGLNDLSLPPLSVLGAIGAPLILLAVLLELVVVLRQWLRRRRGPGGPAGPGEAPAGPVLPQRIAVGAT